MSDDATLLRSYVMERSEAAFAELVRRHLDLVYSAALRQVGGDAHLARDVSQTVFVDLARKAPRLTERPALAGWLYTGACYAAATLVRSERRRRAREQEAQVMHELIADENGAVRDWERLRPVLDAAMLELNETDRTAVVLRYFSGRTFAEVGAALRLNENAARKRVDRALDKLHGLLARRGVTSATAALALVLSQNAVAAAPAGLDRAVGGAALEGGAAAGGGLTASFLLMSNLKIALYAAVVLALTALLFVQQWSLQAAQGDGEELQKRLARLQAQTFAVNRPQPGNQEEEPPAAVPAEMPVPAAVLPAVPEPTASMIENYRAHLDDNYAALFRRLKLGQDKLVKLRELLVERSVEENAVARMAASDQFERWSLTEQQELRSVGTELVDAKIRTLVGEEAYAYFSGYVRTLPWRSAFSNYQMTATARSSLETPFTDEQIDRLAAWAAESAPNRYDQRELGDPPITEVVVQRAAAILDDVQLGKLKRLKGALDAQRETTRRVREVGKL